MRLEIELVNEIDLQEFRKTVCFISPNIQKFSFQDNKLIIECSEQTDLDALKDDIINISSKYKRKSQKKEILYEKKSDWT